MNATRREVVGWLGVATLVAPSLAVARPAAAAPAAAAPTSHPLDAPPLLSAAQLLAPLAVGSSIGTWTIVRFGALHAGAVGVELSTQDGEVFHIDICASDAALGAPTPPAATARCQLFVANEGSGHDPTQEQQGLAAMALAEVVRTNEHHLDLSGLQTLRERLAYHGEDVVRTCARG